MINPKKGGDFFTFFIFFDGKVQKLSPGCDHPGGVVPFFIFSKKKKSSPPGRSNRPLNFGLRDLTDSMTFSSAPKAFQSLENTHRKRSVSLFFKSLEFYASSIELSEDGKNGKNGKNLHPGDIQQICSANVDDVVCSNGVNFFFSPPKKKNSLCSV